MLDFEEGDQHADSMLRAGGLRLREGVARAPVPARRTRRRSHSRGWIIAGLTAVAIIAGLIAIGTNRDDQSLGNDPGRLRWLLTDLPEGWNAVNAFDPQGAAETDMHPTLITVYATDDAPLGPVLGLRASLGPADLEIAPGENKSMTNYEEITIDHRRAVFADLSGERVLYVEIDGHWAQLQARNIDDSTLRRLAASVVRSDDGSASIPSGRLLDGLRLVVPPTAPFDPMIFLRPGAGVAISAYAPPGGQTSMTLSVDFPRLAVRALDALSYELKPVKIGNAPGFFGSVELDASPPAGSPSRIVYWQRDGLAFRLIGSDVPEAEMIAAAVSARPASSAEWDALVRPVTPAAPAATELAGTTRGDAAPADTVPAFTGEPHDVATDVSVAEPSPNKQVWSGTLPTGDVWRVDVTRVYDNISFFGANGSESGPIPRPPGTEIGCCSPVNVVTADPKAAALRVLRSNGDRYTIPLHDLPGTGGLRLALIGLPDGSAPQRAELIDADGNVLQSAP